MTDGKAVLACEDYCDGLETVSRLSCQIKLVPLNAPYFKDANLLIAAGGKILE